jgi:phage gpG-like protein
MLNVTIGVEGIKDVQAFLKRLKVELASFKPELERSGDFLTKYLERYAFETEGGIFGERWKPLNQVYQAWKAKKYSGAGILERSGTLRKSYVYAVMGDTLELENEAPYAVYHQSTAPRTRLPRRPILGVSPEAEETIRAYVLNGIIERIRRTL